MKTIQDWLDEYGASHQNPVNKRVHWICVPLIFFSIVGLLHSVKLPFVFSGHMLSAAMIALVIVSLYYVRLSFALSIGMLLFSILCIYLSRIIGRAAPIPLWEVCLIVFALAWVGQFWGHKVEGKKPSFFKDIQFLMIGPAWLMSFIYRKLKIQY